MFGEDLRRDFLWKLCRTMRNLRHKVRGEKVTIVLCVRSFLAYAMAKLDYIGTGVFIYDRVLEPLETEVRAFYRAAYGTGPWCRNKFLTLPVQYGGAGAPDLRVRMTVKLAEAYVQSSHSRNLLSKAAV